MGFEFWRRYEEDEGDADRRIADVIGLSVVAVVAVAVTGAFLGVSETGLI